MSDPAEDAAIDMDSDQDPVITDLPQEITESYGTGAYPDSGRDLDDRQLEEMAETTGTSPLLTGGDIDAA